MVGDATILVDTLLKSDTKPNVITFTTLLRGWCDVGDMNMAYKILKSMIELGYEPNVRTWTVILHGLCQQNALSDAMHLVETMSATSNAKPNVVTFTTLVRPRQGSRDSCK